MNFIDKVKEARKKIPDCLKSLRTEWAGAETEEESIFQEDCLNVDMQQRGFYTPGEPSCSHTASIELVRVNEKERCKKTNI